MYINPETLSNQSTPAPGLLPLTEEQESMYLRYNGFVRIVSADPVEIEPDVEALESWKAAEAAKSERTPTPTQLDLMEAQVAYTAMMTDTLLLEEVLTNEG